MIVYGDDAGVTFESFQLMSRDGDVLLESTLEKTVDKRYKTSTQFVLPQTPSYVVRNEGCEM